MKKMKYQLMQLDNNEFVVEDFEHIINLGNGKFYYVLCENKPYLKVEVDLKKLFDDAIIFNDYLMIGTYDKVFFVDLANLSIAEMNVEMYFGYFVISNDAVYVLDGTGIIAFDAKLNEIWRNHSLAVDGVTFQGMIDDEIMSISCEMDPPGGWVDRKINIKNGEIVG